MGSREVALKNLALADKSNRKGTVSKWRQIQNSLAEVYFELGGSKGLISWINEDKIHKRDFYNHICRSLGSKVEINMQGSQVLIMLDDTTIGPETSDTKAPKRVKAGSASTE